MEMFRVLAAGFDPKPPSFARRTRDSAEHLAVLGVNVETQSCTGELHLEKKTPGAVLCSQGGAVSGC